uniref:Serpin A3-8 n=2 Tax=Cacopsylla melanoneura TaxID=428564 RepID=A0A8D8XGD5_9HEMI
MYEAAISNSGLRVANNDFTMDVYRHLTANTSHNAIISPFSLHMVLGLTFFGAAGSTADAMMKGLRIKHSETLLKDYKDIIEQLSKSPELKMANTIYFAQDVQLNPIYQSQAVEYFNSELSKTDFTKPETAAKQMNDWVSNSTESTGRTRRNKNRRNNTP